MYEDILKEMQNRIEVKEKQYTDFRRNRQQELMDLAREVDLMMENFRDIAILYPNVPVADVEMLIGPTKDIGEAIKAKDAVKFSETYKELTAACNSCHQAIGREYIVIQVPTASPFSNQVFPLKK